MSRFCAGWIDWPPLCQPPALLGPLDGDDLGVGDDGDDEADDDDDHKAVQSV